MVGSGAWGEERRTSWSRPDARRSAVTAAMRAAKRRVGPRDPQELAQEHTQYAAAQRQRAARILTLEREVCALVISAWGLGAEDVELLRRTAPPRTPTGLPMMR